MGDISFIKLHLAFVNQVFTINEMVVIFCLMIDFLNSLVFHSYCCPFYFLTEIEFPWQRY